MDANLVEMLALTAGLSNLPEHLELRCDSDDFWSQLERTPQAALSEDQKELIRALGIDP
ncbi:MAG: hypothetical protein P1V81_17895 [Planctomycetota bacterium]|nr:hypothetical protein [Planctomycetota bacterium]